MWRLNKISSQLVAEPTLSSSRDHEQIIQKLFGHNLKPKNINNKKIMNEADNSSLIKLLRSIE